MDVEKTIQFILEQQAQFWAGLQQLREAHEAHSRAITALTVTQARQLELSGGLSTIVGQLAEAQTRTEQRLQELTKVVDDLVRRDGQRP